MMRKLISWIKQKTHVVIHAWFCRSWQLACTCAAVGLPLGAVRSLPHRRFSFTFLGFDVSEDCAGRLVQGHHRLLDLRSRFPDTFQIISHGEKIRLSARGITIEVGTWGDVDVVHEMLVRELYHFDIGRRCVVWDVGMNVGMASLFFAAMPDVLAVHGYELFRPTWEQAKENFSLNPSLAGKITSHAFGLGASSAELELPYHEEMKGVVGLDGPLMHICGLDLRTEKVRVIPAVTALDDVRRDHAGLPVVLKMDCEGAEGDILESLGEAGRLEELSLVLLEWHGTPIRLRLEKLFAAHGFITASQPFTGADVGAMTAVRAALS
jgi:FkbM family methyltransferase